ncbi:GIN domain-containing protein [Halioxenophilus aromaticivorans]
MSAASFTRIFCLCAGLLLVVIRAPMIQAEDELYSKTIPVSGVTELEVHQGFRVVISQGEEEYVRAVAHPDALSHIVAELTDNRLRLGSSTNAPLPVLFEIQLRNINRISLMDVAEANIDRLDVDDLRLSAQGAGEIALGVIHAQQLDLTFIGTGAIASRSVDARQAQFRLAGSGSISVDNLTVGELELDLSSSAGVHLVSSGSIDSSSIHLSGTGIFNAANTVTRQAEIDIAGSASALVNVTESLDVSTSGSGTVTYYGNPNLDTGIFGSGLVEQAL